MGTYYEIVNFDKKERIGNAGLEPLGLWWGVKWGSFSHGSPQMRALAYLLLPSDSRNAPELPLSADSDAVVGRWYSDRIGIEPDYTKLSEVTDEYADISPLIVKAFMQTPGGRAILELDKAPCMKPSGSLL